LKGTFKVILFFYNHMIIQCESFYIILQLHSINPNNFISAKKKNNNYLEEEEKRAENRLEFTDKATLC